MREHSQYWAKLDFGGGDEQRFWMFDTSLPLSDGHQSHSTDAHKASQFLFRLKKIHWKKPMKTTIK